MPLGLSRFQRGGALAASRIAALVIVAAWPFIFLAPYVQNKLSVGNDFSYLYFNYKIYLLSMLSHGHFPLWSPTEGAGMPFFSNPFAQVFYPLNLVYFAYYKALGRFIGWDYQILTILGISIYGVGLYLWLSQLAIRRSAVLVAVLVAISSLKITEILRFPNAVHSAAWMPWLLYAATLAADRRRLPAGAATFGVCLLMLLTAGYPYFIVYAVFLLVPYVLALSFRAPRRVLLGYTSDHPTRPMEYLSWISIGALGAAILAFPALRHTQALMAQTVDRGAPDFEYATAHHFGPLGTLGSWVFPPAAQMEGWYYFGIATTLIVAFYLLCAALPRALPRDRALLAIVIGWMAVISYFTWGRDSALFVWVWHHVPVLDQMRVWGRMNIILVPAIALLLALALARYLDVLEEPAGQTSRRLSATVIGLMLITGVIVAVQSYLYTHQVFDSYWRIYFKQEGNPDAVNLGRYWRHLREFDEMRFLLFTVIAALALISLLIAARIFPRLPWSAIAMLVFLSVTVREMFFISNYQWMHPAGPKQAVDFNAPMLLARNFDTPRSLTAATIAYPSLQHGVGLIPNWGLIGHANNYTRYYLVNDGRPRPQVTATEAEASKRFYGADPKAQRIFLTRSLDHGSPVDFLRDVDAFAAEHGGSFRIEYYDGDELRLAVATTSPCWLTFVDNWDPNWKAWINGAPIPIAVALGSYKAVKIPAGESQLVFKYRPPLLPDLRQP